MNATVLEVCVGMPADIEINGEIVSSGIFKSPVKGPVELGLTNLAGDGQANLNFHGGREKAVYVYSASYYPDWQQALGREHLEASQFGQNITIDGLPDHEVRIGDVFRLGSAVVEVAQPRIPCAKLTARVGREGFASEFLQSGRLGYYLYTVETGTVQSGDSMTLMQQAKHNVTVADLCRSVFTEDRDSHVVELGLNFPHVDEGWKKRLRAIQSRASQHDD